MERARSDPDGAYTGLRKSLSKQPPRTSRLLRRETPPPLVVVEAEVRGPRRGLRLPQICMRDVHPSPGPVALRLVRMQTDDMAVLYLYPLRLRS